MPALPSSLISSLSCTPALTAPETADGLLAALDRLPDPRARRGVRHRLTAVVVAAVCAVITGCRSCDCNWTRSNRSLLSRSGRALCGGWSRSTATGVSTTTRRTAVPRLFSSSSPIFCGPRSRRRRRLADDGFRVR
ncbi:transposase family protein [Actinoplanes lobatus]|uniref:transposase family protein n=1 Tax=Actinoplanes lobatus TaxID=113568 RepID=UPI001EF312FE|nr:transposase family protein [Actinoplanes lobatus]